MPTATGTVWGLSGDHRRRATALVRTGDVYDLAVELSRDMPQGPPETFPRFSLTPFRTPQALRATEHPPAFDFSMETIAGSVHTGTHVDGLAHIHCAGRMAGDQSTAAHYSDFGWLTNGAERIPPIITRGVLLDVAGLIGREELPADFEVRAEHLIACLDAAQIELADGDCVLVRTGWIRRFLAGSESYFSPAPGVGRDAAVWLYERGMVILGTDTSGTEPQPIRKPAASTHQAMLVERQVLLLEILDLERLAAQRVTEFLFVCLPLKFVGATGSWVRPVAVV